MKAPSPHLLDFDTLESLYSPRLVAIATHAMTYPESTLEAPWDFPLVKVGGKILCMLDEVPDGFRFTCKLSSSHTEAMELEGIQPTNHGLGRSGWVTLTVPHGEAIDVARLHQWIEEAFYLVAPKRVQRLRDSR